MNGAQEPSTDSAAAGPPLGRRERKRKEVRERLGTAALELFVERGFEATSMDAIAERADVARATVFNYFPQKVSFLEEWGVRRRAAVAETLARERPVPTAALERLRQYLHVLVDLNEASRAETVVLMDASAHFGRLLQDSALEEQLARIVAEGQSGGELRADSAPSAVGMFLAAGYFASVLRWIADEPEPFSLRERVDELLTLTAAGLLPRTAG